MRLAVYLDYVHRRDADGYYAPRAFALFVAALREEFEGVLVAGRVAPEPGRSHYAVPGDIQFVEMPHYASAADGLAVARTLYAALRRWDAAIRDADVVWVLGPQGLALPLVLLALARRKRVVLGVRQDLPAYARARHPGRRFVHAAADLLDSAFRALARFVPAVVVGPALAARYGAGPSVLPLTFSLVSDRELEAPAPRRRWDGELIMLSVGRLEEEKNPLLLADILARVRAADPRWRLVVCGEGPLAGALSERLTELGVRDAAQLRGYLPLDDGLRDAYREANGFLHVSRTEGLPQVLFESFAAGLPVVATAVGSVPEAGGDAVLLVPADDCEAAAAAVLAVGADEELRDKLTAAGVDRVRRHTMEAEVRRTADFLKVGCERAGARVAVGRATRAPRSASSVASERA
jgi:glycosyltransferase involved in cell wall biosynthesis